jgi:FMN phosphatase YigB (HAD superfamily)
MLTARMATVMGTANPVDSPGWETVNGIYKKPNPKVYQLVLNRFALPAAASSFQSSNGWDVYSAAAFGMRDV